MTIEVSVPVQLSFRLSPLSLSTQLERRRSALIRRSTERAQSFHMVLFFATEEQVLIIVHTKVSLPWENMLKYKKKKKWGSNNRIIVIKQGPMGERTGSRQPPTCLSYCTVQLLALPSSPPWAYSHSLEGPLTFWIQIIFAPRQYFSF